MTNLEIYGCEESGEKVLRLKLFKENNSIKLVAVDNNGERLTGGYLLGFSEGENGKVYIYRNTGINTAKIPISQNSDDEWRTNSESEPDRSEDD